MQKKERPNSVLFRYPLKIVNIFLSNTRNESIWEQRNIATILRLKLCTKNNSGFSRLLRTVLFLGKVGWIDLFQGENLINLSALLKR